MNDQQATLSSVTLRRLTVAGLLTATALLLSGVSIPFGPTKCFPFQHAINAIGGILLGPWWAAGTALTTSVLRVAMGTGTLFAFPGSIPGALAVGFAYRIFKKDWCALAEPLGTGPVGASLSALLIAPAMGKSVGFWALQGAFLTSALPGCIIGYAVVLGLRKSGMRVE